VRLLEAMGGSGPAAGDKSGVHVHSDSHDTALAALLELLRDAGRRAGPDGAQLDGLLSVKTLAAVLGRHPNWVYVHARELGAIRLGLGSNPPIAFEPEIVVRGLAAMQQAERKPRTRVAQPRGRTPRRPAARPAGGELLPVKPRLSAAQLESARRGAA
jgi:hypothetical protein